MIRWTDSSPDATFRPLKECVAGLPVTTAALLWKTCRALPIVFIERQCRSGIDAHLRQAKVELGGLLLGRAYALEEEGLPQVCVIAITQSVPSRTFKSSGVSLRMDSGVWEAARGLQDADDVIVVGWYHSHPNLGAFFSSTDRTTQGQFFNQPYSVGLVIDPFASDEKWFLGARAEEIERRRVLLLDRSSAHILDRAGS